MKFDLQSKMVLIVAFDKKKKKYHLFYTRPGGRGQSRIVSLYRYP